MIAKHLTPRNVVLSLCLIAAAASAQTTRLVVAGREGWTTTVAAKNQTGATATLPITDCTSGPLAQLRLEPDAQTIERNIVPYLCALRGAFGLLEVPDVGRLETQLRYHDPSGASSFFVIPALRLKLTKHHDFARVPMIVNDDMEQAWVVLFGDPGPITFDILNESGAHVRTEVAQEADFISSWKMLVYPIEQRVSIGTLVITEGDKTHPEVEVDPETYYGFVIIGARDGSSNYVRGWE